MTLALERWARRAFPLLALAASGCIADADPDGAMDDSVSEDDAPLVVDSCPAPNGGVEWNGRFRFMYGVNYAWNNFAGDFGGISQWNLPGVAASAGLHEAKLKDMRARGASTVRWWVFPEFRGDGVNFDGNENPTGLGGTAIADLNKALELADKADVYLMLTLFSFDGFRPSQDVYGVWVPGIAPMVKNTSKRQKLLDNVVRPLAAAAQASPYRHRLVAWDIINEPEWAMTGPSPYGDDDYDPSPDLDPVTHGQMEDFVKATISALRAESDALITVGGAGMKWGRAWSHVDVDFYQLHIYDWVNQYWPYHVSPDGWGFDKPVVMGEFPMSGLTGASYQQMLDTWYANGFAGAMGWQYIEATASQLGEMDTFGNKHPCETHYSSGGGACTNIPPDSTYTCAQQAGWGKCGESWMQGYCNQSCGRC